MTDRPILFSAPMVRALLDGRKSQTRRIYIPPAPFDVGDDIAVHVATGEFKSRYEIGDRLWVREAWRCNGWATDVATIFYRANERDGYTAMCEQYPVVGKKPMRVTATWRPGIHMPRWASRLTLTVTGVKIERIQNISESDAKAEGAISAFFSEDTGGWYEHPQGTHVCGFAGLWTSINGADAWDNNPFVVAVSFNVAKVNVDTPEVLAA